MIMAQHPLTMLAGADGLPPSPAERPGCPARTPVTGLEPLGLRRKLGIGQDETVCNVGKI